MNRALITRFLRPDDIPALLRLESRQWDANQVADEAALAARIAHQPRLCVGVFCTRTGQALASLFMRPVTTAELRQARSWKDCVGGDKAAAPRRSNSLFGISLTSIHPAAAEALLAFFWPHALKEGWRDVYLGSPVPGLRRALAQDPALDVGAYVRARRAGVPRDAQLRYYHRQGFRDIVAVLPDYFPHPESLDHGVLLRGGIPLAGLNAVWRRLPLAWLQSLLGRLADSPRRLPGVLAVRADIDTRFETAR